MAEITMRQTHGIRPVIGGQALVFDGADKPANYVGIELVLGAADGRLHAKIATDNTDKFAGLYDADLGNLAAASSPTGKLVNTVTGGTFWMKCSGTGSAGDKIVISATGGQGKNAALEATPNVVARALEAWTNGKVIRVEVMDVAGA